MASGSVRPPFCSILAIAASWLPVLAGRGALTYRAGPTGGYLLGVVLAAALCGWLAERGGMSRLASALPAMLVGAIAIHGAGLTWLTAVTSWHGSVRTVGFLPFIPGDLIKVALAAALSVTGRRVLRGLRGVAGERLAALPIQTSLAQDYP